MRIANYNAQEYVSRHEEFRGSNLYAEYKPGAADLEGANDRYVVYSYGPHFPIFIHTNGRWYGNTDRYSQSTTRHQWQARPREGHIEWISSASMWALAEKGPVGVVSTKVGH